MAGAKTERRTDRKTEMGGGGKEREGRQTDRGGGGKTRDRQEDREKWVSGVENRDREEEEERCKSTKHFQNRFG